MQRNLSARSAQNIQSIQRRVAKLQSVASVVSVATVHHIVVATTAIVGLATRTDDLSQKIMVAQRTNIYG